ncbi:ADP-dependent NAD(P)H-hydrate dehydratase [Amnibacterium setariae]|uniref:ADP-dependent (S)-NAD(P)H-hydrate dehydratase n=1 Tax=Amnibacterium setariae TaxID=2306585 RepID=A0A3A1U6C7_9MICO|nr:ADP/ATP-dependent (S)-NAD(P)H-hydrate dehydratase [Amnibacterium setariae]RIX31007.1 NAD(P)H-hydrate dehydratase [Amnibacterium setariae]
MTRAGFSAVEAARAIAVPSADSDKYSRGVLGVVTGSDRFPGAAVLGVEAASRTGVGMIRYLGPERPAALVLARRPEVVTADGRVQAWLLGSGTSPDRDPAERERLVGLLEQRLPVVLDAGSLDLVPEAQGPAVLTPHFGELVPVLAAAGVETSKDEVAADPERWAVRAAAATGTTVLLKGATTMIADPDGLGYAVRAGQPWLATAGSGDVLGGVLGALLATHSPELQERPALLAELAAAAAWIHGEAGRVASRGGPIQALDVAEAVPAVIRRLLAGA